MHRATPVNSSFRGYTSGGARALIGAIDDLKGVQEVAGSFMKGEARKGIEHAMQYGLASIPFDADKGEGGKPGLGPESFVSFISGNRSFPSMGPIDDRRHRMKGLEKGDVALFRGKDDGQQFHMNGVGTFLSTFAGKKLRMQVLPKPQQQQGGQGQAGGGKLGQKPVYKQATEQFFEVLEGVTNSSNKAISAVADSSMVSAVKNGVQQLVAGSFQVGAPSANLRAGDTPTPDRPTAFNIIGTAAATVGMYAPTAPPGTSSTALASTEFVGAAIAAIPLVRSLRDGPPVVTGSWADGTAFTSLMAALVALGLITDQTTP